MSSENNLKVFKSSRTMSHDLHDCHAISPENLSHSRELNLCEQTENRDFDNA